MDTTRLVTIRSFSNDIEADIAKQHLESAGIQAFVRKDNLGYLQVSLEAFLEVREQDVEAAGKILESRGI
jgi:hypothetical protein